MTVDFESDQFLTLLTDALRAGPGSPAWHEAVNKLKQQGVEGADEYKLLLDTRQNLESGKPYREIRAGVGFTKKVMSAIDEESAKPGRTGIPTPTIIAILAALVGIAVIVLVVILTGKQPQPPSIADLQARSPNLTHDLVTAPFDRVLPAKWNRIGAMKLSFEGELRPASQGNDISGGGIVTSTGIPANQPVAMEVTIRPPNPGDDFIMQIFVTTNPTFSPDRGTSKDELVWDIQSAKVKNDQVLRPQVVLPDGTFAATGEDLTAARDTLAIRVAIDANFVLIDSDGKRLYAGENHLAPDKPRYFGVRFLTTKKGSWTRSLPAVESVRILK